MFESLSKRLSSAFNKLSRKGHLSEKDVNEMLREVRVALLEADVHFKVAKDFINKVKEKAIGTELFESLSADQTIIKIVRDELQELLGGQETSFNWASSPPTVILMCGLQGSGKTTTCAKLAKHLLKQGKKPMIAACDIQRPAAITQLEQLGKQIDVPVFSDHQQKNPVKIAQEALSKAKYYLNDVLIVDTAGRLSIDDALMDELEAVQKATQPSEIFLVLDASTGQEAVNVAEAFHEKINLTGAIFTKLDGDMRGGAVLSVKSAVGIPVRFIGLGEGVDAIDVFYPDRMAQRILGMGDVLGLIEKVEEVIEKEEVEKLEGKFKKGTFDFEDMLNQLRTVRKMGPLKNVMKMIPGISNVIPDEALNKVDEGQIHKIEAIIQSMTLKERRNPDIIKSSRKKRISAGSGTSVQDLNLLLKQLNEMRKNFKHLSKLEKKYNKYKR